MSAAIEPAPRLTAAPPAGAPRLLAIDALRGLIMIVMALDHANFFVAQQHSTGEFWGGPLPHYDSVLAFLTRFVTHFAAPGFFCLMGMSMVLFAGARTASGWDQGRIMRYFVKRGSLLLVLQFLVENPGWAIADPSVLHLPVYCGVLYGLGGCMILSSFMLRLGTPVLAAVSVAAIAATHLLMPEITHFGDVLPAWQHLLLVPGTTPTLMVYYPVLPWLGTTLFGFIAGRMLLAGAARGFQRLQWLGVAFLALFAVLRGTGGFGNLRPPESMDWMALLNLNKYPPSLTFSLLFLGTDLILLAWLAKAGNHLTRWGRVLLVYGQSALFFYLAHLYLYGIIGKVVAPKGMSVAAMYPYWLLGLIVLFPLCRWYGAFKQRQPAESLWRFL